MFGIGFGELVLIVTIGIVALGPQRCVGLAKTLGRMWGRLHNEWSEFKREIDHAGDAGKDDTTTGPP